MFLLFVRTQALYIRITQTSAPQAAAVWTWIHALRNDANNPPVRRHTDAFCQDKDIKADNMARFVKIKARESRNNSCSFKISGYQVAGSISIIPDQILKVILIHRLLIYHMSVLFYFEGEITLFPVVTWLSGVSILSLEQQSRLSVVF